MKRLTKAMLTLLWIPAYQVHSAEPVLIGDCGEPATFISVVQGDGLKSALIDEDVVIEGVVTKSSASISGFFVHRLCKNSKHDRYMLPYSITYRPNNVVSGCLWQLGISIFCVQLVV